MKMKTREEIEYLRNNFRIAAAFPMLDYFAGDILSWVLGEKSDVEELVSRLKAIDAQRVKAVSN